jgi:hypothetical protein
VLRNSHFQTHVYCWCQDVFKLLIPSLLFGVFMDTHYQSHDVCFRCHQGLQLPLCCFIVWIDKWLSLPLNTLNTHFLKHNSLNNWVSSYKQWAKQWPMHNNIVGNFSLHFWPRFGNWLMSHDVWFYFNIYQPPYYVIDS